MQEVEIIHSLLLEYTDIFTFPAKVKVGISACIRCCTLPKIRDVGFIGTPRGWELYFGGNGGYSPRIGNCIASGLQATLAVRYAAACLNVYCNDTKKNMRTSRFMETTDQISFLQKVEDFIKKES